MKGDKAWYALKQTILAVAVIHLGLLAIHTLATGQFVFLNILNILDSQLYFPRLEQNFTNGLIASLPLAGILAYFYRRG